MTAASAHAGTRAQKGDVANYRPGDVVVFHHDVYGVSAKAGDACRVVEAGDDGVLLAHPDGRERRIDPSGYIRYRIELYETRHKFIMHSLERREALEASAARRGVAFPDLADYDSWRNSADEAVSRGEDILANPEDYGLHLHSAARGGESLASALSRVREMLADDDRHLAETLVGRRQGESVWEREEHIARLLNDPDELRKLRHQRAERRRAGQRQRKGRYQSRGITM